ncbi:hypothetical protein [Haloplanus natans]|uniref:hypothetical protein n=1 Tax=Haloplanus natans TaxID=376171 RepID=UPI000677F69C|nr:hypothetical protein [Haloplanus natans]
MIPVDEDRTHPVTQYGDALRAVTRFRSGTFETRMREDVRTRYTDLWDQRVVDEIVLEQLRSERLEDGFKCGRLTGTVHVFDEALVVVQADSASRKSGYLVTFDRDNGVTMADLEDCFEYLRTAAIG